MQSKQRGAGQAVTGEFDRDTTSIMPYRGVIHLHLLRHGEVDRLTERVVRGQLDVALSDLGKEQTRMLADWIASLERRPDRIYSSDLTRCRVLAQALSERVGVPPEIDDRLREQDMGAWQGKTWREVTQEDNAAVTAYWDDYANARPTDGESYADLVERVAAWRKDHLDDALPEQGELHVVVTTHIGVIRAFCCALLGVPISESLRFAPAVGSYTSFLVSEAGAVLSCFGERPWKVLAPPNLGRSVRASSDRPLRLAMSGSASTGKTTLGRRLAEHFAVPYVEEGMRTRLEQGLVLHELSLDGHRDLVRDMWREQAAIEDASESGFVADRSSIDFAAFWLHYSLYGENDRTEAWIAELARHANRYDLIILLPWGVLPLEADGVRSTNRWVQLRYQSILEGMLERYCDPGRLLCMPAIEDLDERCERVLNRLETLRRSSVTP